MQDRARAAGVTLIGDTHTTCDMDNLTFEQIIDHHNRVLCWFDTPGNKVMMKNGAEAL